MKNPDVAAAGVDPFEHFVDYGLQEGRAPGPDFEPAAYLFQHDDVARSGTPAFLHYLLYGRFEGRAAYRCDERSDVSAKVLKSQRPGERLPACNKSTRAVVSRDALLNGSQEKPWFFEQYPKVREQATGTLEELCGSPLMRYLTGQFGAYEALATIETLTAYQELVNNGSERGKVRPDTLSRWLERVQSLLPDSASPIDPEVSIVVPVHNQLRVTLGCIESILRHKSKSVVEIVLFDDASTDETNFALESLPFPIQYHRTDVNVGFLRACNAAAKHANGSILVFLNNDTVVLPGFVDELVWTLESDAGIGAVGSKLLDVSGCLQEAGGLVWSDASAWNFGRFADPNHSHFSFLREMDYCSAAALAVPTEFWRELGGFDELFRPAYYEDTDFCFRVRAAARKVFYQPLAQAIHLEGISHGRDISIGLKTHQEENRTKFYSRWQQALSANGPAPAEAETYYCRRHIGPHVLFVDALTPTPDRDSGSNDAINFLRILRQLGFHTSFLPLSNRAHYGKYTRDLQRIGVECLYEPHLGTIEEWLRRNGERLTLTILTRADVAWEVLPLIEKHASQSKIIFNTVDLHFLRETREAELHYSPLLRNKANATREKELELIRRADVSLVVSGAELDVISEAMPDARVENLPLIREMPDRDVGIDGRRDVMFIGGFNHPPNGDAVKYFVQDIWPLILEQLPGVRFHVIGSNVPEEIYDLASSSILVHGYVEDLSEVLAGARVTVAPLRYGAGQKGKVVTSLSYGVPAVVSSIAAEGMDLMHEQTAMIADKPEAFAAAVVETLRDDELWKRLSFEGEAFVRKQFSFGRAKAMLVDIIQSLGVAIPAGTSSDSNAAPERHREDGP